MRGTEHVSSRKIGPKCFTVIIREEVGRLVDANAVERGSRDAVFQTLPDGNGEVLGGWNDVFEFLHLEIQMTVIVHIHHLAIITSLSSFRSTTKPETGSTFPATVTSRV